MMEPLTELPDDEFISFVAVLDCTPDLIEFIHICGYTREATQEDIDRLKTELVVDPDFGRCSEEEVNKFSFIILNREIALKILEGKDLTPVIISKLKEANPKYIDA